MSWPRFSVLSLDAHVRGLIKRYSCGGDEPGPRHPQGGTHCARLGARERRAEPDNDIRFGCAERGDIHLSGI